MCGARTDGKLGAVGVLERQDQSPPLRVVAQRRASVAEHRRGGTAGGAKVLQSAESRVREGDAAADAEWLGDEAGLAKAVGAQQARRVHRCIAGDAARRQQ